MLRDLREFARHLRGKGPTLFLLLGLGFAGAGVSLSSPLLAKAFVDAVATRGDYSVVPWIAGGLVGVALLDLGLGVVIRLVHTRLSAALLTELRQRLLEHCLCARLDELEGYRHGDLLSRFGTDIPQVQGLLVDGVLGGLRNLLTLGVAAVILVRMHPGLAAWSFLGVAAALTAAVWFRRPVEAHARRTRLAMVDLSHFLAERLAALRPIRIHGAVGEELGRFLGVQRTLVRRVVAFQGVDAAAGGVPGLLLTCSLAWIYWMGGGLLESGSLTLGTFVAFVLYQGRLFGPAQGLLGLVRGLQEAKVSVSRVAELLRLAREPTAPPTRRPEPERLVRLSRVSFSYPGRERLLEGVDLDLGPGERVVLIGASGAGKSTLVQLLFGLRSPGVGTVRLGGGDPRAMPPPELRRWIGYAGAEPFLLHATVEENLCYARPDATEAEMLEAARIACAHGFILSLPQGYRTVVGGRGLTLSDGQRQRLGLARLVLQAPRVFVLDEALSGLDPETERRVWENLTGAFPDRSFLVITHRPERLSGVGRVLRLEHARLVPASIPDEPNLRTHSP
ncbi:ABC transporter ATP-binding protein [Deferrisoma camini]|uniref:ABC transporter ATP-binding protein n=1 Tax=Deferrisoma camini TaxID=1035120 RepID=UPI00046D622F|nr:ABC transporter ATP-binding protein [Deferrisoma camini]